MPIIRRVGGGRGREVTAGKRQDLTLEDVMQAMQRQFREQGKLIQEGQAAVLLQQNMEMASMGSRVDGVAREVAANKAEVARELAANKAEIAVMRKGMEVQRQMERLQSGARASSLAAAGAEPELVESGAIFADVLTEEISHALWLELVKRVSVLRRARGVVLRARRTPAGPKLVKERCPVFDFIKRQAGNARGRNGVDIAAQPRR